MKSTLRQFMAAISYNRDILISIGFLLLIMGTIGFMYSIGRT